MPSNDDFRFYIDGAWVERPDAQQIAVRNPYSEEVIGHIAAGSGADVDLAVAAARRAFATFAQTPVADRLALLTRIKDLLEERSEQFAQAIVAEMGAAIGFARAGQCYFGIEHVRVAIQVLRDFAFESEVNGIHIRKEPIGVVAAITPWNWPLYQITAKVAPALAAGCTLVLKPSELSPFSALLFAQVMHDAGAPPGVFNLVNGTGEVVGNALSGHPDVDMVSFTGSTRAGVLVAQNAAPTRMVVPAARLAEVEALATEAAEAIVVGDPLDEGSFLGPLANGAQFAKVQELIQVGIDEGARLLTGGPGRPNGLNRGYFARPTVFSQVTPAMRIAQEEIFGPVLVIQPYEGEDDAI